MIISASRRTDIPAFFTPWLINRVKAGFLLSRNPFNSKQIKRVSLLPQDVDAIVFWTRNPIMLMQFLPLLDDIGYLYYFQYTITGYPRIIDGKVPNPHKAIQTFIQLSDRIGTDKIVWRYDPILLSNIVNIEEHKRLFSKIATALNGKTKKVVISFADFYKKTERNLKMLDDFSYSDISKDELKMIDLVRFMHDVATENNIVIETCAESIDLSGIGINHGKCIDEKILKLISGRQFNSTKDTNQREACGCIKSFDIGSYNTCLHGCSYCYATYSHDSVMKNRALHNDKSPFLIGEVNKEDEFIINAIPTQGKLF